MKIESAPVWFAELPRKLYDAARDYPLDQKPEWDEFKDLEDMVKFEGVTAYSEWVLERCGGQRRVRRCRACGDQADLRSRQPGGYG